MNGTMPGEVNSAKAQRIRSSAHRQLLKSEHLARGISQEGLAELAGLQRIYVGSVERGERNIAVDNMEALANALGQTSANCSACRPHKAGPGRNHHTRFGPCLLTPARYRPA
jgi:hypothetical protein